MFHLPKMGGTEDPSARVREYCEQLDRLSVFEPTFCPFVTGPLARIYHVPTARPSIRATKKIVGDRSGTVIERNWRTLFAPSRAVEVQLWLPT